MDQFVASVIIALHKLTSFLLPPVAWRWPGRASATRDGPSYPVQDRLPREKDQAAIALWMMWRR